MHINTELTLALNTPPIRDCGVKGYSETLGLPRDPRVLCRTLGGIVIDVGSGYGGFADDVRRLAASVNAPTRVININPQLILEDHREIAQDIPGSSTVRPLAIAALVEHLPIASNVADSIVSSWAFPLCNDERRDVSAAYMPGYAEIIRVLKPGGNAFVGPVYAPDKNLEILDQIPGIRVAVKQTDSIGAFKSLQIKKLD